MTQSVLLAAAAPKRIGLHVFVSVARLQVNVRMLRAIESLIGAVLAPFSSETSDRIIFLRARMRTSSEATLIHRIPS